MQQYQTFIFDSYGFDESTGTISLKYSLDNEVEFVETIRLPEGMPRRITDPLALDRAMFALHLIGGMSYYKTCLPKTIEIRSGKLTKEQAEFWNSVYQNGLGEFFYQNQIDFRGLINFPSVLEPRTYNLEPSNRPTKILTPVGGGKDSIVTIELLKKSGMPQTLFRVGSHPLIDAVAQTAGTPLLSVKRALSPVLFDLNEEGALNGHVPITAYLSCLCVVMAELYGFSHIAFSNERSANEGNTEMFGMEINHQWSKSMEFETAFRDYVSTYITKDVEYFSLLRPLSELHIVQLFSEYPQYFGEFTSCNTNWRILSKGEPRATSHQNKSKPEAGGPRLAERWCGQCPKCAFAFAMLAAFLPKETVVEIFNGKNLFEYEELVPLFEELLGIRNIKPFECVGTPEETYAALMLASEQGGWDDTPVMKMFDAQQDLFKKPDQVVETVMKPSGEHAVPATFAKLLPLA